DRRRRESRAGLERPPAVAQVLEHALHEPAAERFAALLLESFPVAEFDARPALRLRAIEPGALEIVGTVRDVDTNLLLELGVRPEASEPPRPERAHRREDPHGSPGRAARAAAIAAESRFQSSVSSRRPRRPAAVSS